MADETSGEGKVGYLIAALGLASVAVGVMAYRDQRRQAQQAAPKTTSGGLGRLPSVRDKRQVNGMTLTHYYDKELPIQQRVEILQNLVHDSVKDPENRKLALALTSKCPARDGDCEARAIYDAVRRHVRYTGDVAPYKHGAKGPTEAVDMFQAAKRTWEFKGGDCDDHAVANATFLILNGIPARFRITAPRGRGSLGGEPMWSHIYTLAGLPKNNPTRWVAIDTTLPGEYFGKEAPYGKHIDFIA